MDLCGQRKLKLHCLGDLCRGFAACPSLDHRHCRGNAVGGKEEVLPPLPKLLIQVESEFGVTLDECRGQRRLDINVILFALSENMRPTAA